MPTKILDFHEPPNMAGFRLQRLEMYNWGTFHHDVWAIDPQCRNSLLTGDIGSGKSTLVDAVTTLLVPHNRIVFNKAAGAGTRERSLYSYIRGEYKNVKYDYEQTGKAVALRDENACTILLGYFYNHGFKKGVTLAQVFWLKDNSKNPERFFVVSESVLSIAMDFADFGNNILDLKKRLKKRDNVSVVENFKTYSTRFRRLFGIKDPQALDLFHQTVSMKSVGNLTEFIRLHMLDKTDVEERIREIRKNFDNLNKAHSAVIKAKEQIQALTPIVENGKKYIELEHGCHELCQCREALNAFFAFIQIKMLKKRIEQLQLDIKKITHNIETLDQALTQLRHQAGVLRASIDDNGGRRIQDIQREILFLEKDRDLKKQREKQYLTIAKALGIGPAKRPEDFFCNLKQAGNMLKKEEKALKALQDQQVDTRILIQDLENKIKELDEELISLKSRKSNIPHRNLELRTKMAKVLDINEEEMPFVGELIKVDEEEARWEGALERVLHNFGLSLVVPDHLYAGVCRYVDKTHLKGRLVYFKVPASQARDAEPGGDERSLIHKIRIKPDSPYYAWLSREMGKRFDYICCDTMEDFYRQPRALTMNGQIKTGARRHEKDDRHSIFDRSRYILGWQNKEKIKTLEKIKSKYEQDGAVLAERLIDLVKKQDTSTSITNNCRQLLNFTSFDHILWQEAAQKIQALMAGKEEIEQSSDILITLKKQLDDVLKETDLREDEKSTQSRALGSSQQKLEDRKNQFREAKKTFEEVDPKEMESLFPRLKHFKDKALQGKGINLNNLARSRTLVREYVQTKIDNTSRSMRKKADKIIRDMQSYKNNHPAQTSEVDASLESMDEFNEMLDNLVTQDLPRHEAKFKDLLNQGTINSIALFQNQLDKKRQEIEQKIEAINTSLSGIEYSPGTYIELLIAPTQDSEIRDFQSDIKQCLSHTLDGKDIYNEQKFLQVKQILDRFNGRELYADLDRKWTAKVTDVRNWFVFSAVEKWQEDHTEKEFYSDSSGKSGGQKEKLAYTILASALAFQFGLEWGAKKSRTFRFVVVDEAFGRGSDESTRYGLELFKKLNLQLLIVTPLQKINIIEDYINAVHFVHNEGGKRSILKNLTVDEYRKEKQQFLEKATA